MKPCATSQFARVLRQLMDECGDTQSSLARAVPEVSQSSLSHYLAGRRVPMSDTLLALSRHFGVPTDYLLGRRTVRGGGRK